MALTPEERQARLDQLKAERTKRLEDAAKARAAADPMKNPTVRPEAPPADSENVYYYAWIGGASSGNWKLYEQPLTGPADKVASAEARSEGGATQATFSSAVGAQTLKGTATTGSATAGSTTANSGSSTGNNTGSTTQNLPAGFTPGPFPAELEKYFGAPPENILGYKLTEYKNAAGQTYYKLSISQKDAYGNAISGSSEFGAPITKDASGKWTTFQGNYSGASSGTGTSSKTVNGSTTGLTQADIDAAVAKAVAEATAKTNAAMAQIKAEQEAAKLSAKQKASDKLSAMFAAYGLESLAPFISSRIMADVSEEMLLLELYDRPEYQQRFPGMKDLRAKKRTITEGEYMKIEKEMTQTARFFDLPVGFYDNPSDFGKLIANEVSAKEYQDRLQVGQDLARTLNPSVKSQLLEFYGVGEGALTAYVLDPDKALSLLQKQAKAAMFVGIGRAAGFQLRGITSGQAENIAGTEAYAKLSEQQLAQALGQAGQLRTTQSRLAGIEGQAYSEEEALKAVVEGSPEALLASQQRAQREAARFGGRSGLSGTSLRSTTAI